ncbi:uncharacterized protein O3C94_004051 [Discoglossus pictus]
MDSDYLLALQLQEQYDRQEDDTPWPVPTPANVCQALPARPTEMSVVDPSWELLDPIPDIRALFLQFNDMFFWGKLSGVEVKWSPRMTLCAGVCSYEGRGGLCSVRLSEPLLKLRPRKDLVETLLHEMIHALLFVTHNNKDHDSHGPEFCKHMNRINGLTGAKISVYHSFHGEVDEYRKHWWLCNGPCQKRKPYFGYVKRAMNRAPSSLDPWWSEHQRTCGGTFVKVKEPENYSKKGKRKGASVKPQVNKEPEMKGKSQGLDIHTIVPFSGVGYKLVESKSPITSSPLSETAKPVQHSPPNNVIQDPKKIFPIRTFGNNSLDSKKHNVPKISVANTKMFINIDGSPIKLPVNRNNASTSKSPSKGSKREFPSVNMIQKKISFGAPSSSQTKSSNSRGLGAGLYGRSHLFPTISPGSSSGQFKRPCSSLPISSISQGSSIEEFERPSSSQSISSSSQGSSTGQFGRPSSSATISSISQGSSIGEFKKPSSSQSISSTSQGSINGQFGRPSSSQTKSSTSRGLGAGLYGRSNLFPTISQGSSSGQFKRSSSSQSISSSSQGSSSGQFKRPSSSQSISSSSQGSSSGQFGRPSSSQTISSSSQGSSSGQFGRPCSSQSISSSSQGSSSGQFKRPSSSQSISSSSQGSSTGQFGRPSSSQTISSSSQGSSSGQDYGQPYKKPRMDDKKPENFFVKKSGSNSTTKGPLPNIFNRDTGSNSSIAISQSAKVNCPACQSQVYASKINDHLDACLAKC